MEYLYDGSYISKRELNDGWKYSKGRRRALLISVLVGHRL
jgi:hypothetical protein